MAEPTSCEESETCEQLRAEIATQRRRLVRQLSGVATNVQQAKKIVETAREKSFFFSVLAIIVGLFFWKASQDSSRQNVVSVLWSWLLSLITKETSTSSETEPTTNEC